MIGEGPHTKTSSRPQPGVAGNCAQGPRPGLARGHPPPPTADPSWGDGQPPPGPSARIGDRPATSTDGISQPGMARNCTNEPPARSGEGPPPPSTADLSQERRGTATWALGDDWRGTANKQREQTPTRNGGELHQGLTARIGKGPRTTINSGPLPGMAENPPMALSQDCRGTAHINRQQTPARSGRERYQGPSARIDEGPPTTNNSGPQPGVAGNCTQGCQPGLARDHPPPHHHQQRAPAKNGGELPPGP